VGPSLEVPRPSLVQPRRRLRNFCFKIPDLLALSSGGIEDLLREPLQRLSPGHEVHLLLL